MTPVEAFKEETVRYVEANLPRIRRCFDLLTDDQLWLRPGERTNSVANLVLHLCGNITQYVLSGLGGRPDGRRRDEEFSTTGGYTRDQLLHMLEETIGEAVHVIRTLEADALTAPVRVQGFTLSGTAVLVHVTEHASYHTGQIALLTKILSGADTGFYAGIDLNGKNDPV